MNNTKHRSPFAIAARLIVLVRPMLPIMLAAIVMGVIGHFCATFITIFGGFALLTAAGLPSPLAGVGTAFVCILVFALLRGVLRYAEQASNHYIAFTTTPGSMLLPARLHTTVAPLVATASAMRLEVVVLPLVPVTTTLRSTRLARSLSSSGSIFMAMRPGSTPPWRLRMDFYSFCKR